MHYVDAYLKPMNTKLEDGTSVKCKRRGLKIVLSVGTKKGEGLMRRLDVSRDPIVMLDAALQEAAKAAGRRTDGRRRRDLHCERRVLGFKDPGSGIRDSGSD